MKVNFVIYFVAFVGCCDGYNQKYLTANPRTATKSDSEFKEDMKTTQSYSFNSNHRPVRGIFLYTYDDSFIDDEIEMTELNSQDFYKIISKYSGNHRGSFNLIEFFDGRCDVSIKCKPRQQTCSTTPSNCECTTTSSPPTSTASISKILTTTTTEPTTIATSPETTVLSSTTVPTTTSQTELLTTTIRTSTTTSMPTTSSQQISETEPSTSKFTTTTSLPTTKPTTSTNPSTTKTSKVTEPTTATKLKTTTATTTESTTKSTSTTTRPPTTSTTSTSTSPPVTTKPTKPTVYPTPAIRASRVFPKYIPRTYAPVTWTTRSWTWTHPTGWTPGKYKSLPRISLTTKAQYRRVFLDSGRKFVP